MRVRSERCDQCMLVRVRITGADIRVLQSRFVKNLWDVDATSLSGIRESGNNGSFDFLRLEHRRSCQMSYAQLVLKRAYAGDHGLAS